MSKRRIKRTHKKKSKSYKNGLISGSKKVTKSVTSGLNTIGKKVTGTTQSTINRFFGLFGKSKTRRHRKK